MNMWHTCVHIASLVSSICLHFWSECMFAFMYHTSLEIFKRHADAWNVVFYWVVSLGSWTPDCRTCLSNCRTCLGKLKIKIGSGRLEGEYFDPTACISASPTSAIQTIKFNSTGHCCECGMIEGNMNVNVWSRIEMNTILYDHCMQEIFHMDRISHSCISDRKPRVCSRTKLIKWINQLAFHGWASTIKNITPDELAVKM